MSTIVLMGSLNLDFCGLTGRYFSNTDEFANVKCFKTVFYEVNFKLERSCLCKQYMVKQLTNI